MTNFHIGFLNMRPYHSPLYSTSTTFIIFSTGLSLLHFNHLTTPQTLIC